MKSFVKSLISAAALAVFAAAPLAASALTIGVSDEVDSSITSGHVCEQSNSANWTNGTESTVSVATKNGTETDSGLNGGYVIDPASTSGSINGKFNVNASTVAVSNGTYGSLSTSSKSMTGAQEVDTALGNTVSTFVNP